MNKKAVVFTIIAIMAVSVLLMYTRPISYVTLENRIPVIKNRVMTINDFFRELSSSYTENVVKTASQRAIKSYIDYLNTDNFPAKPRGFASNLDDFLANVKALAVNGTDKNQVNISLAPYNINYMEGYTVNHQLSQLKSVSKAYMMINTSVNISNLMFFQNNDTGPWRVGANYTVIVETNDSMASWNMTGDRSVDFDINGFEDPYILLNTLGFAKMINATNFTLWNRTNFEKYINGSSYKAEQAGISFIARFYNDINGSDPCCGIETVLPKDDAFKLDSGDYYNRSFVDYCYFNNYCPGSLYMVNESNSPVRTDMSSDVNILQHDDRSYALRIDPYHYAQYGLTGIFQFGGKNHSVLVKD